MAALVVIWFGTAIGGLVACLLGLAVVRRRADFMTIAGLCFVVAGVLGILSIGLVFLIAAAGCFATARRDRARPAPARTAT